MAEVLCVRKERWTSRLEEWQEPSSAGSQLPAALSTPRTVHTLSTGNVFTVTSHSLFIHSINSYQLPGTVLGTWDTLVMILPSRVNMCHQRQT